MKTKYIKGFDRRYSITNTGIVISHERKIKMPNGGFKIQLLHHPKLSLTHRGYLKVMLNKENGERKGFFVHRLVALAFLEDSIKPQVNHKDKNKLNNNVSNLEWVTNRENCIHRFDKNKTSSKYYGVTRKRDKWQALVDGEYLGLFNTQEEARDKVLEYNKKGGDSPS